MADAHINEQRLARLLAQDFLAANPKANAVSLSFGNTRICIDRSGRETLNPGSDLCNSLGLDSDTYTRALSEREANGTPLSPEEIDISEHLTGASNENQRQQ